VSAHRHTSDPVWPFQTGAARLGNCCVLLFVSDCLIVGLAWNGVVGQKWLVASDVLAGPGKYRLGLGQLGLGIDDRFVVSARVDAKQQLAFLDLLSRLEALPDQLAGDTWIDVDLAIGFDLSHQINHQRGGLASERLNDHLGWWRRGGL